MLKIGVDASTLVKNRTGVANYIYELLIRLVDTSDWQFLLYSNKEICFPERHNVFLRIHRPFRKGPAWVNTQLLSDIKNDAIDVFWGGNGYLPVYLPKRTASVLTVHDLVYKQAGATMPWISRWSRRIFQPLSVRQANVRVAVSKATAYEMEREYACTPNSIINPQVSSEYAITDETEKFRVRHKYHLPAEFMLVLGTLEPRKNLSSLLQAYISEFEDGAQLPLLAVAGGRGWLEGELPGLVKKAEDLGIAKRLGYVDQADMKGLYAASSSFILPSLHEGFGMPALEAQLCGVPVLVSEISALREATADIACLFQPTLAGIKEVLRRYAEQSLPLVCRLPYTSTNKPEKAAASMRDLIIKAHSMVDK